MPKATECCVRAGAPLGQSWGSAGAGPGVQIIKIIEINEPWGVNEFFYILEGSITLTSADGTVTKINAGEAVSIPKEWTGIWDTDGYDKIWVIHSEDGSALE